MATMPPVDHRREAGATKSDRKGRPLNHSRRCRFPRRSESDSDLVGLDCEVMATSLLTLIINACVDASLACVIDNRNQRIALQRARESSFRG